MRRAFMILPLVLALMKPALADCRAQDARYVAADDARYTAGFMLKPPGGAFISDLAFYVHSAVSGRTYWFLFDAGSARYISLISAMDVTAQDWQPPEPDGGPHRGPLRGTMHFLSADEGMRFSLFVPTSNAPPPSFIVLPDIQETLWYGQSQRDGASLGAYRLTGCAK